jgi:hypothetical protein
MSFVKSPIELSLALRRSIAVYDQGSCQTRVSQSCSNRPAATPTEADATPAEAVVDRLAFSGTKGFSPRCGNGDEELEAFTVDDRVLLRDPRKECTAPPFPKQPQTMPGLAGKMNPMLREASFINGEVYGVTGGKGVA